MDKSLNKMSLIEMEPYINGNKYLDGEIKYPNATVDMVQGFIKRIREDVYASTYFDSLEYYADFYEALPDVASITPKELHAELFYAAKNGYLVKGVPSQCIYEINKAYELYKIPGLIPKLIPKSTLKKIFTKGYLTNGYCLKDIICSLADEHYKPISPFIKKVKYTDFTEVYVAEKDMILAVPNSIGDILSDSAIDEIREDVHGLITKGQYICQMAGFIGFSNSKYDLRGLL